MSTSPATPPDTSQQPVYECAHCQSGRTPQESVHGSYCSHECYYEARGQKILREIREDHRFCGTCYAQLKETVEPTDEWRERKASPLDVALEQGATFEPHPGGMRLDATDCEHQRTTSVDAVIGFQYLTPAATKGLRSLPGPRGVDRAAWTTICRCGNTDHRHHEPEFHVGDDARTRTRNLLGTLHQLYREDELPQKPDSSVLVDSVYSPGRGFRVAYAIGRSVYGPDDR